MSAQKIIPIILIGFYSVSLNAQTFEPATKINVEMIPSIQLDQPSATFLYQYKLVSKPDSIQSVRTLMIGFHVLVGNLKDAAGWTHLERIPALVQERLGAAPRGVSAEWWQTISWNAKRAARLAPGKSVDGFGMSGQGLPGIVSFFARGFVPRPMPFLEGQAVDTGRPPANQDSVKGSTIGPEFDPHEKQPADLIDRLILLKHQALSLGWIFGPGSDGIASSLDAKLDAAKDSVARGNNTAAKNQLNAFINDLDAQRGKHVNDNAYFLLKTNAQFILSKL